MPVKFQALKSNSSGDIKRNKPFPIKMKTSFPLNNISEKILSLIHFMMVINLELVLLDPNSPRAIEFWMFHPRSATLNPRFPVHQKHLRYPLSSPNRIVIQKNRVYTISVQLKALTMCMN
ncbi:UNVERIFIED_CONTAM: hypothetical protein NCL1_19711 [Trichonephila clavipes]